MAETTRRQVTVKWPVPGNLPGKWYRKDTILYEFPEEGSFIGLDPTPGRRRPGFLYCPMNADGTADFTSVGTIDNVDDDEKFVAKLNAFFGTDAKITDFPGR